MVRGVWESGYVRVGVGDGGGADPAAVRSGATLAPVGAPASPDGHSETVATTAPVTAATPTAISTGRFPSCTGARRRLPVLTAPRPSLR
jgi:hypothetical protein